MRVQQFDSPTVSIPTPDDIRDLSRDELARLFVEVRALEGALLASLLSATDDVTPGGDRTLNTEQIAAALGVSRRWLFAAVRSKRLPFVRRVSKKSLLASERDVTRWLKSRGS